MAKGFQGRKSRSPARSRANRPFPGGRASPRAQTSSARSGNQGSRGRSPSQIGTSKRVSQRTLSLRNRQRVRRVNLRLLRRIVSALLQETWPLGSFDLAIHVVAEPEMTRLNETYLRSKGSTDVITFDYTEEVGLASPLPRSGSTAGRGAGLPHHSGGLAKSPLPTTKEW